MGNVFGKLPRQVYPDIEELKVIKGPDEEGCYFIKDSKHSRVSLLYHFTDKYWEFRKNKEMWKLIPMDLSMFNLKPRTIAALVYLRDVSSEIPRIPLALHMKECHQLGIGYYGKVYKVKFNPVMGHQRFFPSNTALALKTINQENTTTVSSIGIATKALENEIDLLCGLSHNCIVKFYQQGRYEGQVAMVTELCTGGNAQELIKKYRKNRIVVPENIILNFISHCLQALAYIHSMNIAHRDFKPDNVFVMSDPHGADKLIFKLGDFGLAKVMKASVVSNTGCELVHAPEIVLPMKAPATSAKSDMWAFGFSVFMMCTNSIPYCTPSAQHEWLLKNTAFPTIDDALKRRNVYRKEIQEIVSACLDWDQNRRATAASLFSKYEDLLDSFPTGAYY